MIENLKKLENLINSELTSKIQSSFIANDELTIETNENDLIEIVQFLKSNEKCKFRQLIDIVGVDYPDKEKRFNPFASKLTATTSLYCGAEEKVSNEQIEEKISAQQTLCERNYNYRNNLPGLLTPPFNKQESMMK